MLDSNPAVDQLCNLATNYISEITPGATSTSILYVQLVLFSDQGIVDPATLATLAAITPPSINDMEGAFNSVAYAALVGLSKLIETNVPGYQNASPLTSLQIAEILSWMFFPLIAESAQKAKLS